MTADDYVSRQVFKRALKAVYALQPKRTTLWQRVKEFIKGVVAPK